MAESNNQPTMCALAYLTRLGFSYVQEYCVFYVGVSCWS